MRACVECAALCMNTGWRRLRLFGRRHLNTRVLHVASVHYGGVLKVLCLMFSVIFLSSVLMLLLFCLFSTPPPRQLTDRTRWKARFSLTQVFSWRLVLCCRAVRPLCQWYIAPVSCRPFMSYHYNISAVKFSWKINTFFWIGENCHLTTLTAKQNETKQYPEYLNKN